MKEQKIKELAIHDMATPQDMEFDIPNQEPTFSLEFSVGAVPIESEDDDIVEYHQLFYAHGGL